MIHDLLQLSCIGQNFTRLGIDFNLSNLAQPSPGWQSQTNRDSPTQALICYNQFWRITAKAGTALGYEQMIDFITQKEKPFTTNYV